MMVVTNNDTIDSQGDDEDEDDEENSSSANERTMRLSATDPSPANSQRDDKEPVAPQA